MKQKIFESSQLLRPTIGQDTMSFHSVVVSLWKEWRVLKVRNKLTTQIWFYLFPAQVYPFHALTGLEEVEIKICRPMTEEQPEGTKELGVCSQHRRPLPQSLLLRPRSQTTPIPSQSPKVRMALYWHAGVHCSYSSETQALTGVNALLLKPIQLWVSGLNVCIPTGRHTEWLMEVVQHRGTATSDPGPQ